MENTASYHQFIIPYVQRLQAFLLLHLEENDTGPELTLAIHSFVEIMSDVISNERVCLMFVIGLRKYLVENEETGELQLDFELMKRDKEKKLDEVKIQLIATNQEDKIPAVENMMAVELPDVLKDRVHRYYSLFCESFAMYYPSA